jgi:aryl-alcohol dehydrogenase-like predicted oxidoreductase
MTFGETWGWGADKAASRAIFDAFVNAGGNFIDTANNYTAGTSEAYDGEFASDLRDEFVIATKYTLTLGNGNRADPNLGGNSRKSMMRSVEASLRRLQTDAIDILYLHMGDFTTPVEEVMRGADDLVRAGKVHYFAFSDTPAWIVAHAIALADRYGWPRPIAVQLPYSVLGRDPETDFFPMANHFDLAVITWGMLNGGTLTGKYNRSSEGPKRESDASEREKQAAARIMEIASRVGCSPAQLALSWVQAQEVNVVPILGARTADQLRDNLGVLDLTLDPETINELAAVSGFTPGFPRRFLTSPEIHELIFGSTYDLIDNHRDVFRHTLAGRGRRDMKGQW